MGRNKDITLLQEEFAIGPEALSRTSAKASIIKRYIIIFLFTQSGFYLLYLIGSRGLLYVKVFDVVLIGSLDLKNSFTRQDDSSQYLKG